MTKFGVGVKRIAYNTAMQSQTKGTRAPRGKAQDAHEAFVLLLAEATRRGYYGTVSLTLNVQDGFIQHVKVATERLVK